MRMLLKGAVAAALMVVCASGASAANFAAEVSGARADGRWGGELGVSYRIGMAGFHITPTVGAFIYKGDNDRYFEDDLGNGQTRCRDSTNGQFAKNSKCDNTTAKPYGRLEVSYKIPAVAEIGAGARFSSDKVRPYGTVSVPLAPQIGLKGNAGDGYFALGLTLGY